MSLIECAGLTDVGRRRDNNEDEFLTDDSLGIYLVADGMGGHKAGEVASKMVVETVYGYLKTTACDDDATDKEENDETLSFEKNRILSGIKQANKIVYETSLGNKDLKGMGSTISALYFLEYTCIAANVGDSPVYLIRNKKIKLVSIIHNVFAEYAALNPDGKNKPNPKFRHMLTRSMGISENVEPDISEIRFLKNDIFVICSDGLSDKLSPDEIKKVAGNNLPENACRQFIDIANERGGDDNITVIVAKVKKTTGRDKLRVLKAIRNGILNIKKKILT